MIERNHLEIIRAVDTHGTLTAAAAALHLSQSALSHAMTRLEQQLGVALWEREGRRLRFTRAGRQLLAASGDILPRLASTEESLRGYARGRRGQLRIGMECHPCYEWLLQAVPPYLDRWPDVDLDVRQRFQFGGLQALADHEIDALITPDPVHRDDLRFQPVFDYELRLVVAENHALADRSTVEPEDLADQHLITYPVPHDRLDVYTRFLIPAARAPAGEQQIEATEIMLHLVAAGRGVTVMPGWLADSYRTRLPIASVRLGAQGLHKQIFVGLRERDRDVDYLASFIGLCRAA